MTYREEIVSANSRLAEDKATIFVGYGIRYGRALGTIKTEDDAQLLETTLAENLLMGMACGLSLRGRKPVAFIERADFIWHAMDAIVNHIDSMAALSRGQFKPAVIIRVVVGNRQKPLFTGLTHTRDNSRAVELAVSMPVYRLDSVAAVAPCYAAARERQNNGGSTILYEFKDLM